MLIQPKCLWPTFFWPKSLCPTFETACFDSRSTIMFKRTDERSQRQTTICEVKCRCFLGQNFWEKMSYAITSPIFYSWTTKFSSLCSIGPIKRAPKSKWYVGKAAEVSKGWFIKFATGSSKYHLWEIGNFCPIIMKLGQTSDRKMHSMAWISAWLDDYCQFFTNSISFV